MISKQSNTSFVPGSKFCVCFILKRFPLLLYLLYINALVSAIHWYMMISLGISLRGYYLQFYFNIASMELTFGILKIDMTAPLIMTHF